MTLDELIYYDSDTPISSLIELLSTDDIRVSSSDITVSKETPISDDKIWSPQITSYSNWVDEHDKIQKEGEKRKRYGSETPQNKDKYEKPYDLLTSGNLHFGTAEPVRKKIIKEARRKRPKRKESIDITINSVSEAITAQKYNNEYVITEINLRQAAALLNKKDNLVVVIPAYINDMPVTKLTATSFLKQNCRGIHLKLLVIPNTVEQISADTFSSLFVDHIHLGKNLKNFGPQTFNFSGKPEQAIKMGYSIHTDNAQFTTENGNLYSKDKTELFFYSPPYKNHEILDEHITTIDSHAFVQGAKRPEVATAPHALSEVNTKHWDEILWLCDSDTPIIPKFKKRGVRIASTCIKEHEHSYYDISENEAVFVMGPPPPMSASKKFAMRIAQKTNQVVDGNVPQSNTQTSQPSSSKSNENLLMVQGVIAGKPVTKIKKRALPYAPETVILPQGILTIEDENTCRGTKQLTLPAGLKTIGSLCFSSRILENIVTIPKSVYSVGGGSFQYAKCLIEAAGTVVHTSSDQLKSCFIEKEKPSDQDVVIPFDFDMYDKLLLSNEHLPDKVGAALHRLCGDYPVSDIVRLGLLDFLSEHTDQAIEKIAREGKLSSVKSLTEKGFIDDEIFDKQVEALRKFNRTDCVLYLMKHKNDSTKHSGTISSRFAL